MPRPSSIDRLPPALREEIGRLRQSGRTIDEIMAKLGELDASVSRTALGRHVQRLDKLGSRLRQSRALAEGLARELGDKPGDQVARVNIELLHSFLSDALAAADEAATDEGQNLRMALQNPKGAALFAEAVERLTKASRHNAEFVAAVEKRAREAAAERAKGAIARAGLSAETRDELTRAILGLAA